MALVACWECGERIGETAEVCPRCGSAQFEYHQITVETNLKKNTPQEALQKYIEENLNRKPNNRDRYIGDGAGWEVIHIGRPMKTGIFTSKALVTMDIRRRCTGDRPPIF